MLRTFNCGFGMAAFVAAEQEVETRQAFTRAGLEPVLIGRLKASSGARVEMRGRLPL